MMALFLRLGSCYLALAIMSAERLTISLDNPSDAEKWVENGEKWVKNYVTATQSCIGRDSPECKEATASVQQLERMVADPKNYAESLQRKKSLEDAQAAMEQGIDGTYTARKGYSRDNIASAIKQMLAEAFQLNLMVSKNNAFYLTVESFIFAAEGASLNVLGVADATLAMIKSARKKSNCEDRDKWVKKIVNCNSKRLNNPHVEEFCSVVANCSMYTGELLDQGTVDESKDIAKEQAHKTSPGTGEFLGDIKLKLANLVSQAAEHGLDVTISHVISSLHGLAVELRSKGYEPQMSSHQNNYNMLNTEH